MSAASTAANRANAQLSTGPITEEGKQRSSLNGLTHGLTSKLTVLPGESQEAFDALESGFFKTYAPASVVEEAMVSNLAAAVWRLERMQRVETALFANRIDAIQKASGIAGADALAAMFVDPAEMNRIRLFLRYLSETNRAYNKALRDLQAEQKARKERDREKAAVQALRPPRISGVRRHYARMASLRARKPQGDLTAAASADSSSLPADDLEKAA